MALPSGITPKSVTVGIASFFDGSLADGTATITAPVNVVHTPTNRPIFSSQMSHRFVDGETSFNLAPTDADGLNRKDWTYKLNVVISGALVQPEPVYFTLPTAGPDTIDLDSLVTVPSSAGTPIQATVVTSVNGQTGDVTVEGGGGSAEPLPLMVIDTTGGAAITSKDVYLNGTITVTGADAPDFSATTQIRGRGNYTWGLPKKPYRLKLTTATGLLGLPVERDFALLANHTDPTLLNTALAMNIGQGSSGLVWTPRSAFCDLVLNGEYVGVYQLIENVEISTAPRIPGPEASGTTGDSLTGTYSLEIDPQYGMAEPGFTTTQGVRVIYDAPKGDVAEQAAYISGWVQQFETALYGTSFTDATTGYARFVNRDSFIDWYLINELASNQDSPFNSSCKLFKTRDSSADGGRLHMGPLWDFDISFGNVVNTSHPATGLFTRPGAKWINRMMADPAFAAALNTRWLAMVARLNDPATGYAATLDRTDAQVAASRTENNARWAITAKWDSNVQAKKAWIAKRIAWLTTEFAASVDGSRGDNANYTNSLSNSVAPAITGTATTGSTLTVSNGTWSATPDSYTYQWKRGGQNIGSATAATYVLVQADEGQSITATVTAIKSGYVSGTSASNSVTPTAVGGGGGGGATAFSDNFNRTASATTLGAPWQALRRTWGVHESGAAYTPDGSDAIAMVPASSFGNATNYVVTAKVIENDAGTMVLARVQDADNFYALYVESGLKIFKKAGGFAEKMVVGSYGIGDVVGLKVEGNVITAMKNGVAVGTWTDTDPVKFTTGGVGLRADNSGSPRWDDFTVTPL